MFEDALKFPWHGEKKIETLILGGLLTLLGVLFIPILFVYGYVVRVVRQVAAGEDAEPPTFSEWGDLFVDGIVAFVISLVYAIVPTVFVVVGAFLFIVPVSVVEGGPSAPVGGAVALFGVLLALAVVALSVLLALAALYLFPAAVAVYARSGRFGSAFSPSTLRPVAGDRRYATGWLVAVVVSFLAQVVASVVAATGIGGLLVPFVLFYGYVAGAYAVGVGVADIDIESRSDDDTTATQPAV